MLVQGALAVEYGLGGAVRGTARVRSATLRVLHVYTEVPSWTTQWMEQERTAGWPVQARAPSRLQTT
jgi:hypothetical protein